MFLISSRRDVWDDNKFSQCVILNPQHQIIGQDALLGICANWPVLILVHGYLSPREKVLKAYQTIEQNLDSDYVVIGFTWPAGSRFYHYLTAKNRCPQAAFYLQHWLYEIGRVAAFLDVNTHSLGARVLFHALRDYTDVRVRNVFALAPAVDDECLQAGEKFSAVPTKCKSLTAFYSRRDPVLKWAYPMNDFDKALGLVGPANESRIEASNVSFVDCSSIVSSHGGYKDRPEVYARMAEVYQ